MIHLFKIELQLSDMFIRELLFDTNTIWYQIRDKQTGALLEPESKQKFEIQGDKITFGSRFIHINLAKYVNNILHDS